MSVTLGIYEKALRDAPATELFESAARLGFSFLDLSIDESRERQSRLRWTMSERIAVREAALHAGVRIGGVCLSVHRAIGLGSADPNIRVTASKILRDAIYLCRDLGVSVLQLAGYYAFYEDPDSDQHERYVDGIAAALPLAAKEGVILGIENVDGEDVTSISAALAIVELLDSPWLALYPDIGNLAEQGLDTVEELRTGRGKMVALHCKDVRPGEPRRVAMGTGVTKFDAAFTELVRQCWSGRLMVELWNDDAPDSDATVTAAREFVCDRLRAAGMPVC